MIPRISQAPQVSELTTEFLNTLRQNGFTGDISSTYADRLTMATITVFISCYHRRLFFLVLQRM